MAGYSPLKITGYTTGLVEQREEFLLPDDAYPSLINAYVWREKLKRKRGFQLLGRLERFLIISGNTGAGGILTYPFNVFTLFSIDLTVTPNAVLIPGSFSFLIGNSPYSSTFLDNGMGGFTVTGNANAAGSSINYVTGDVVLAFNISLGAGLTTTVGMGYYPNLPVMGIRTRELQNSANDETIFFDQVYAYRYNSTNDRFEEFIPGTTWNAAELDYTGTNFFWSTNYWVSDGVIFSMSSGTKLFWVTNGSGGNSTTDPVRITDGITWVDFNPSTWSQIDATNFLTNFLCMLPFRGRMLTFNTWEGPLASNSTNFSNRIRWSTIGNPFIPYSAGPPATGSWRDDIRGQGGFLDIPTSEDIVSVGFVRDNLVIYCERSTWQLRYTGRSIAPFQIERVNSELGVEGTFSSIQFDTSLVGIGDKGIVECDSYKSERIDIKIPDFVFSFNPNFDGVKRVQGIRDFVNRLAYWTVPVTTAYDPNLGANQVFPNERLVYNYENDSWAIFTDTLTALGTFQPTSDRTWINTDSAWIDCDFPWIDSRQSDPLIVGGNQQGFIEYLDITTAGDVSLYISAIQGNTTTSTQITCPNHNLVTNSVIEISGIIANGSYGTLNGGIFGIVVKDSNNFYLNVYDPDTRQFSLPNAIIPDTYLGGGLIKLRENFSIQSKKFNFLDEGQNIQLGYLDILMEASEEPNPGAISMNIYLDYDDDEASNTLPQNMIYTGDLPEVPDTFFNSIIPTTQSTLSGIRGTKFWQRVYCATRANFLTIEYTFSNAQLVGTEQRQYVQIDAQVLWLRKAGRMTSV